MAPQAAAAVTPAPVTVGPLDSLATNLASVNYFDENDKVVVLDLKLLYITLLRNLSKLIQPWRKDMDM